MTSSLLRTARGSTCARLCEQPAATGRLINDRAVTRTGLPSDGIEMKLLRKPHDPRKLAGAACGLLAAAAGFHYARGKLGFIERIRAYKEEERRRHGPPDPQPGDILLFHH